MSGPNFGTRGSYGVGYAGQLHLVGLAALSLLLLAGCASSSSQGAAAVRAVNVSLLPAPTPVPAGVTPMTFGPAALGASLSVPTGWVDRGPAAGAQFSIRSVGQPVDFILASSRPWTTTDAAAVALSRSTFLGRLDTTIASVTTGVVAGHPAARLRYQITVGGQSARDVEYDILTGSDVITIIIGTSQTRPDTALVNWIASTLNVQ